VQDDSVLDGENRVGDFESLSGVQNTPQNRL
jgi:hypothetical protein